MPGEERKTGPEVYEPVISRNRLAGEKSPYLLQHAANPVDWYPWGDEAFERAVREDKPVFLSIGYATCHWCHVMAHESFEDPVVASLLNTEYICIKVDREERPDIDSVYMAASQLMTGQGGWPLTIFMTPDKRPFFAATYIPKIRRVRAPGLLDLLPRIAEIWHNDRDHVILSARKILDELAVRDAAGASREPESGLMDDGYEELARQFDSDNGGFGGAPKFPAPHMILFLLRYWHRTGTPRAREMAEQTLDAISRGGICDHVGGGFHRYSIDAQWNVPHFEKMLYDQALLLMAYTEAWQATGKPAYREMAESIISYVLRDLTSPEGAFYSAEDADSPGGEGAFYLWSADELAAVLGTEDGEYAARMFTVTPSGNFSGPGPEVTTGKNVLHISRNFSEPIPAARLATIRTRLLAARDQRARPARDDKVLTDWNGLFIAALAMTARITGSELYLAAAERAMDFLLRHQRTPAGGLLHRYREGESAIDGFADDYAFVIFALIELYESSFNENYLLVALDLNRWFMEHFSDRDAGGFFQVSDLSETPLIRKKEWYDGAVPSANSVAFGNLLRLSRLTGEPAYETRAAALSREMGTRVGRSPSSYTGFLAGLDFAMGPTTEIIIAGNRGGTDTRLLIDAVRSAYLPRCTVLLRPVSGDQGHLDRIVPFTVGMTLRNGHAAAYPCSGTACSEPVTDPDRLRTLLVTMAQEKRGS